jgi:hypothetical protein
MSSTTPTAIHSGASGRLDRGAAGLYNHVTMLFRLERASDKSRLGSRRKGRPAMVVARACGAT